MGDKMRAALSVLAASTVLAAALPASAATLYDNGPANGTITAKAINYGGAVADSFTLTSDSTVDSISFATWDFPGTTLNSVDYAIQSALDLNGTTQAADTVSSYLFTNGNGYHIDENTFSVTPTTLQAGTYYLLLKNASTSTSSQAYWDENDGPSTGYGAFNATFGSESFAVNGTSAGGVSAAPEPGVWALMIAGLGLMGAILRFGRRRSATMLAV